VIVPVGPGRSRQIARKLPQESFAANIVSIGSKQGDERERGRDGRRSKGQLVDL